MKIKTYSELIQIPNFEDRIRYLELSGKVGDLTFGGHRQLNQTLYSSIKWRRLRNTIILRDNGMDLSHPDYEIFGFIYIHHLNPITIEDVLEQRSIIYDPENLVSASFETHSRIHYGMKNHKVPKTIERKPGDTCPWIKIGDNYE